MKNRKILHVIASVNPRDGGPIEAIRNIAEEFQRRGVEVEICSLDSPDANYLNTPGVKVHAMGPGWLKYRYSPRLTSWLRANASQYDAVIVNGLWQYGSFATWWALSKTQVPYFIFTHGMLGPWFKKTYPLKHLKKWLYWPWAEYRVLRDARRVIFTCEEERRFARESFWLYQAREVVTKYGIAPPPQSNQVLVSAFIDQYPELRQKRIVLFVGRIHPVKGCDILIDAFAKVAPLDEHLHLLIVGSGHDKFVNQLKSQARKSGIGNRITWTGSLRGEQKWAAFYAAEVFCLPSHHENFGVVVAEALGCGKPVLISNKVNIWREIDNAAAGFVAEDSLSGTTANLERWLSCSSADREDMQSRARALFADKFTVEGAASSLHDILFGGSG